MVQESIQPSTAPNHECEGSIGPGRDILGTTLEETLMAKVELSMEEFLQLQQMATSGGGGDCSTCPHLDTSPIKTKRKSRKKSASDKKMSKALKEATAKGKLKSGAWKKGWNQSRVMKEAHRLKKKM